MTPTEATSNIIVAMINNKFINTPEEIAIVYKTIYQAVYSPLDNIEV